MTVKIIYFQYESQHVGIKGNEKFDLKDKETTSNSVFGVSRMSDQDFRNLIKFNYMNEYQKLWIYCNNNMFREIQQKYNHVQNSELYVQKG